MDRNYYSRRERDLISGFVRGGAEDDQSHQARLNWDDVVWMKEYVKLPLILKGIATAEDAEIAVQRGADVVWISNHGGRQLDHGEGTLDVLPEVVKAVRGRAEVVLDGGVLRGTDVVKALCLGARAVGVGKLMGYALAAGGEAGRPAHARAAGDRDPLDDGTHGRDLAQGAEPVAGQARDGGAVPYRDRARFRGSRSSKD